MGVRVRRMLVFQAKVTALSKVHVSLGPRHQVLTALSGPVSAALQHHSEIDHLRHIWCFILITTNPLLLWPLCFYPSHRNRQEAKAQQSAALLWTWSSMMSSGFVSRCLEKDCGTVAVAVLLNMSHCRHLPVCSILHWRDLSQCTVCERHESRGLEPALGSLRYGSVKRRDQRSAFTVHSLGFQPDKGEF